MTLQECTALLAPLALAMRAPMDGPSFRAYHRVLEDVPARWLHAAVDAAGKQERAFFPKAGELRALAERLLSDARLQLAPGDCLECDNTRWIEVPDPSGVLRAMRCGCFVAFQQAVAELGSVPKIAQLPSGEPEAFDPRMLQMAERDR